MAQRTTFGELKNCVRSTLEPFLYNKTRRNPIVIPVIINSKSTMAEIEAMRAARNAARASKTKGHGAHKHDKEAAAEGQEGPGCQGRMRKSAPADFFFTIQYVRISYTQVVKQW